MKKITSLAGLALRLTAPFALGWIGAVGLGQWFRFWQAGNDGTFDLAFEYLVERNIATLGPLGMVALVLILHFRMVGSKRSKTAYTLRRLSLSEGGVTFVFALVCIGWFLLYWAVQLGLCLGLYAMYTDKMGVVENLLFVSAFRVQYFHNVLPLYEPWALVRNGVLCLSFGSFSALSARNARNGRGASLLMYFVTVFFWVVLYPNQLANQTTDIFLSVITLGCLALDIIWTWRWNRYEAN